MKKMSPETACGAEPSIGVSIWDTPFVARACPTASVVSGLTVDASQVTRPALASVAIPAGPR